MGKIYAIEKDILKNLSFLKWIKEWITEVTLLDTKTAEKLKPYSDKERQWWNKMIWSKNNKQWTTKLCELSVKELLIHMWYKNLKKARTIKSTTSSKKYNPDWECDNFVWEVKWRSWTTPWTAWEKILWTPLKYSEIPRLYWKPLRIVCVWYQEWEGKNWFACGNLINPSERWTEELRKMLVLFNKLDIEYFWFTDLLEKLNKK